MLCTLTAAAALAISRNQAVALLLFIGLVIFALIMIQRTRTSGTQRPGEDASPQAMDTGASEAVSSSSAPSSKEGSADEEDASASDSDRAQEHADGEKDAGKNAIEDKKEDVEEGDEEGDEEHEEPEWLRDPLDDVDWAEERDTQTWQELSWKFSAADRHEEATRALQAAIAALDEDQADRAYELHQELSALYIQRQELREAHQHLSAARACAALSFGSPSAQEAETLNALGALLEQQGSWQQACAKYTEALEAEQAIYGEAAEEAAATHSAIARMNERTADRAQALQHYLTAYCILREEKGRYHPETEAALEDVLRAYLADGQDSEAFEQWMEQWE